MLLLRLNPRAAAAVRIAGLLLIGWSVVAARHGPGTSGRGLVVSITFAVAIACWASWVLAPSGKRGGVTPDLYAMAAAGGVLSGASPTSAASALVFVAVVAAAVRVELARAWPVAAIGTLALAASVLLYDGAALGLLAYALGFAATLMTASNARQSIQRAEQAELLLAQSQRSQEERLRAARLQESTRIAREIHDVLAHALAGLTIQLEATSALIENDADRDAILARVRRAHELAREGLRETRRAVGALRGDAPSVPEAIATLAGEYRSAADAPARLDLDGDPSRLSGDVGQAVLRAVQEGLTNVHKHALGAEVSVKVHVAAEVVVVVENRLAGVPVGAGPLSASGGGYGLRGMRERAEALGGTLQAGPTGEGWRVALRLPREGRPGEEAAR